MGLELVELVIAIEQHFGVEIPNADAAQFWTTRHVIDYLTPRLVDTPISRNVASPCPTQQAFYRVRHALCIYASVPRADIVPGCPLSDLLPRYKRARLWSELRGHMTSAEASMWPSLKHPVWLERLLFYTAAISFLTILIGGTARPSPGWGATIASCVTVVLIMTGARLTASWRTEFRPVGLTVGDLARTIAASTMLSRPNPSLWTHERIAQDVRALVMRKLGLTAIADDARFVDDLGAG